MSNRNFIGLRGFELNPVTGEIYVATKFFRPFVSHEFKNSVPVKVKPYSRPIICIRTFKAISSIFGWMEHAHEKGHVVVITTDTDVCIPEVIVTTQIQPLPGTAFENTRSAWGQVNQ